MSAEDDGPADELLAVRDIPVVAVVRRVVVVVEIRDIGKGFFESSTDPPSEDRRMYVGGGLPANPTVIVGDDPDDDVVLVKTSEGPRIITVDAPAAAPSVASDSAKPCSTMRTIVSRSGRGSTSQICDFMAKAWLRS